MHFSRHELMTLNIWAQAASVGYGEETASDVELLKRIYAEIENDRVEQDLALTPGEAQTLVEWARVSRVGDWPGADTAQYTTGPENLLHKLQGAAS